MIKRINLTIPPEYINDNDFITKQLSKLVGIDSENISSIIPVKRSIDARFNKVVYRLLVDVFIDERPIENFSFYKYPYVKEDKKVIIIGFGPAGIFSALRLIEAGVKPIIIERGKDVRNRRRDIRAIHQKHFVNPESNYCFGEGGAGTFSDGKLYTRSTKRGNVKKILEILVQHGANKEILIDSHPHIGSNKLPIIIQNIRQTIINCGGEIYFNSKVTDFILDNNKVKGVVINNCIEILANSVIIATGHSGREIYYILHNNGVKIFPKPFALGVRVEHPQSLINEIQYHTKNKHPNLPAASYSLACNIEGRGIYSFCMCPGGIIVPSSTTNEEIVINGMSVSRRDSPFANSGLIVEIREDDLMLFKKYYPFNLLEFQKQIEHKAFELANRTQSPPAQRLIDFLRNRVSDSLPKSSFIGGLTSTDLNVLFPNFILKRLKESLKVFDRKMKGFLTEEAIIVAPESRTSSTIRIPRDSKTLMNPQIKGLFPAGEGAGYAGGIVSAGIDGENVANAVYEYLRN
jgi:uncharacterized FAD-dependent dehydrogenase